MNQEDEFVENTPNNYIPEKPPEVRSVLTDNGNWEGVEGISPGTPSEAFVVVSDTSGITIVAEFNGFWIEGDGTITMPGTTTMKLAGKPGLPRLIEYIEIPHDINASLDMIYGVPTLLDVTTVAPAPEPIVPIWNFTENLAPVIDNTVYSSNAYFPSYNMSMEGALGTSAIVMRGRRLLELSFYPVQYNPVLSKLRYYPKFVVKVNYSEPAQIEPVEARLRSEPFELLFESFLLNFNAWKPQTGAGPGFPPAPDCTPGFSPASTSSVTADYLIITHESIKLQADRLAAWKTQKGLPTEVRTTAQIEADYQTLSLEEGIKELIRVAYNSWTRGPTYVLIFGDSELVPNGYGMAHAARMPETTVQDYQHVESHYVDGTDPKQYYIFHPDTGKIGTDSVYFTVHGSDYVPDIIYGRISVDDMSEAETVVNKVLTYEKSPPVNSEFYDNMLAAAHFEFFDPPDDPPDPPNLVEESGRFQFVRYAEDIRLYLEELGYIGHLNYSTNYSLGTPSAFFNRLEGSSPIDFTGHLLYDHLDHYDWIPYFDPVGADHISRNINSDEGRFLVCYNNHGFSRNMIWPVTLVGEDDWYRFLFEGWCGPGLSITDLPGLTNGDKLPLIISTACDTGWFDGEIDEDVMGEPYITVEEYESLLELVTKMEGGGAIAAIGPTRPTWTLASADMADGIIQAFWPGHLDMQNLPISGMGAAMLFGMMNTASIWGYEDYDQVYPKWVTKTTFQEYHLFGDPDLKLWTSSPSDLTVAYPTQMSTDGIQRFVVTVLNDTDPVYFAKVCMQGEDGYDVEYTNSYGQAFFSINPSSIEPINITVTKHNFRPHIGSIDVINCEATVTVDPNQQVAERDVTFEVIDFDGNEDIHLYYNETEIGIFSGATSITLSVPKGRDGFANIKANDSDEVAIVLFKRYQGGSPVDPYVYCQRDRSTWHLADDRLTYDNPSIEVWEVISTTEQTYVDSNNLEQWKNYMVHVNVTNNMPVEIVGATVTLSWAMFSAGREWHIINQQPAVVDPIEPLKWKVVEIPWYTAITGHICLNATVHHLNDINLRNNFGQENTDVAPLTASSPITGGSLISIGNPTSSPKYVFLDVRQQCSLDSIWRAEIDGLSYLVIPPGGHDNVTLQITPPPGVSDGDTRLFTVTLYIDGQYVGGASIKGVVNLVTTTGGDGITGTLLLIAGSAVVIIVIVIIGRRYSQR